MQPQTKTGFRPNHCLILFCFFAFQTVLAQNITSAQIEKAIEENQLDLAHRLVQQQVFFYTANRQPDSLNNYIFYVGKIAQLKINVDEGARQVEALIQKIKTFSNSPSTLRQSYLAASEYYSFTGKNNLAYKSNNEAYSYGLKVNGISKSELALTQNNMSTCAQRMGDVNLAQMHSRESLRLLLSDTKPDFEILYNAYNGMGSMMWYASKVDSAAYYFNKALETLRKTQPTIINQYYRPGVIQNNLAGIYGVQGKPTEAIQAMKSCISNIKLFISSKEPHIKKNSALSFQFEATDNLAGIYKELGDYRQAHDLLMHSYQQKRAQFEADNPAIFISQILLGQLYYAMKEFDKAVQFLNEGLANISKADGDYLFWQADACNTLALLHDHKGNEKQAAEFYEKADSLYEESLQGEYDNIYLEFLRNAALFYAENKMLPKALTKANKGYHYITKTEGTASLLHFYQLLNLSEVHFASGNYKLALSYTNNGLNVVNTVIRSSNSLLDSVHIELKKPKAILLKAKSEYNLLQQKDMSSLILILEDLKEALNILEKRKSVLQDPKDITLLMADHTDLLEFIKKITLDLYSLTKKDIYADELVSLHESGIYNRIRSRLDKNNVLRFAYLPRDVAEKENKLKNAMANALKGKGSHNQVMQSYIQAEENWNRYLDELRKKYPRYYKMRYASIFKPLREIQSQLPSNTSVVRYFFVGKNLMALVMDQQQKKIFQLTATGLTEKISTLLKPSSDARQTGNILYSLYQQLWQPVSEQVRYKNVLIIPDGILYNLSFETLTSTPITRFEELATKTLLAKYNVAYQYSLFLSGAQSSLSDINRNYVAFAPGFSDEIKKAYKQSRNALDIDNSYLSLLPQPFAISLASKAKSMFGGSTYLYQESTLTSFRKNAGQHKIIYIGTHAEADNLHPEFSKLIFAKNTEAKDENNLLYLFDIYNCDLSSNLTVLTACESGLPGYQDGEGMISLAHAFSYAGSESIITGLWKIDEQVSTLIMDFFYKNLEKGMPKDEALRLAKLSYLAKSNGRAFAPQYWAGLVLIGDTRPIPISKESNWLWPVAGALIIVLATGYYFRRNRKIKKVA